jgi:alginate O-acetyltransferase complex protein AlgI
MLFHSPPFFAFFAVYFLLQLAIPIRYRLWLVLAGGTVFYAYWNPWLLWLPYLLALMGWAGALWVSASERNGRRRRLVIAASLLLGPLLFFKYTSFVYREIIAPMLGTPDWSLGLPLPLGISFVTFTMLAYLIDCYRGVYPVEARPQMVSAYMVFFPHLIAGPILRPRELMPQLDRPRRALDINATLGVLIFTVGLVKKVIFAGQLADPVGQVYAGGNGLSALDHLLAIYGFSLQIYCDFSGYTDMAIGLALLLGVKLPNNFTRPYAAASVAEFWRRWHRTLSFWFRDYVYIPLGGNRGTAVRRLRNVMVTMVLAGLWHGASWTFALWGAVHGACIIVNHRRRARIRRAPGTLMRWAAVIVTFHVVTVAWILFRAPDLQTSWRVLSGVVTAPLGDPTVFLSRNGYSVVLLALFLLSHRFDTHARLRLLVMRSRRSLLWPALALTWAAAVALDAGSSAKFIYFDF